MISSQYKTESLFWWTRAGGVAMSEGKIPQKMNDEEKSKEIIRIKHWIEERKRKMAETGGAQVSDGNASNNESKSESIQLTDDHRNELAEQLKSIPELIRKELTIEKERLLNCSKSTSEYAKSKMRLEYLCAIRWAPEKYENVDLEKARAILDEKHYGMNTLKDEIIEYIHSNNKIGKISNEILLLSGPPGTGKTSIARQIAKAMGRELFKLSLGGLNDEIYIKGAVRQYGSAKPGAISDILFRAAHRKLVILLDEIDKMGNRYGNNDGAASLLDALDHDNSFVDRFLDVPMDLSDIVFIATANQKTNIPPALIDRMSEIEIKPYSKEEKNNICQKHLIPRAEEEYELQEGQLKIDQEVIHKLVEEDYEHAGIRNLTKKIRKICRIASMGLKESCSKNCHLTMKRAVELKIISDMPHRQITKIKFGQVITSYFEPSSGKESLLEIEALHIEDKKDPVVISDNLKTYQGAVNLMAVYMAANYKKLSIPESKIKNDSFALCMANISGFKLDDNHKLAIFCAIYSAFRNITLPEKHVVLGDVTLLGEVRSNYLTRNYVISALNCGAEMLILPKDIERSISSDLINSEVIFYFIEDLAELDSLFGLLDLRESISERLSEEEKQDVLAQQKHEQEIMILAKRENISASAAFGLHFVTETTEKNESAETKLNKLIGLLSIKNLLREIATWKEVTQKRRQHGLISKNVGLHMAFTGNPGTGKTTVAKILGKMLFEKGLVKNDVFMEVTRDDLVGKYIGHTEEKVGKIIQQAMGGVLYIDEAHSLFVDSENDYGQIALSTLVKAMEDNRDELVIIMSGYEKEMAKMITLNSGLADRINFKLGFDDYSIDELVEIFGLLCSEENYELEEGALNYFRESVKEYVSKMRENFSNGRFVRNIFEKAKIKQALRIGAKNEIAKEDLMLLTNEDIQTAYLQEINYKLVEKEIPIGFCC